MRKSGRGKTRRVVYANGTAVSGPAHTAIKAWFFDRSHAFRFYPAPRNFPLQDDCPFSRRLTGATVI